MVVVENGIFKADFQIKNFTYKEMESLLKALLDINSGAVRFGGKVSRGFGQMKIGSFSMTANRGYDTELKPVDKVSFSDIEEAIKYYRDVK